MLQTQPETAHHVRVLEELQCSWEDGKEADTLATIKQEVIG